MFRLARFFAITSLAVLILGAAALGWLYRQTALEGLIRLERDKDVALTQSFANTLWPEFAAFLASVEGLSGEELRARPETAHLRTIILEQLSGLEIVKVKIYSRDGLTVFSTQEEQIGEDQSENPGVVSAIDGDIITELTHRDEFNAFDRVIEDRDVFATYVPIRRAGSTQVEGVFEIYTDVTTLMQEIGTTQRDVVAAVLVILALLYVLLLVIVRYAERIMRGQYAERKRAEDNLQRRVELEQLVAAVSTRFANLTPGEFDLGIEEMLAKLGEMTDADYAFLHLLEDATAETAADFSWQANGRPELPRLAQTAEQGGWLRNQLESGKSVVIDDLNTLPPEATHERDLLDGLGANTVLIRPIINNRRLLGLLGVLSVRPEWDSLAEALGLTTVLTDLVATVVTRQLAEESLRRRNDYLQTLHQTTLAVMNRLDVNEVLTDILLEATRQIGSVHGLVAILAPDQKSLCVRAGVGAFSSQVGVEFPRPGETVAATAASPNGANVVSEPSLAEWVLSPGHDIGRVMEASLRSGAHQIGVLAVACDDRAHLMNNEDGELLSRFAALASLALDSAKLYADLQDELLERQRAEATLIESEARFRTLIQSMDDVVFTVSVDGRYADIMGRSPEIDTLDLQRIIGHFPQDIWASDVASVHSASIEYALQGQSVVYEWSMHDEAENAVYFQTSLSPLQNADAQIIGLVGVSRNLTEIKRLDQLKAEFVANVSHELRTPLASILGYAETILRGRPGPLTPIQQEFLQTIHDSGKRLRLLVDDLLDVSRMEAGHFDMVFGDVDLAQLILHSLETVRPLAAEAEIDLKVEVPPLSLIEGDAQRIGQVLDNLFSNAVKFTPSGGDVLLSVVEEAENVHIAISDTGIGIPAEDLPRLFTRFYRAGNVDPQQIGGTGLGLYITKTIVEAHHGCIKVESEEGNGTTFHIWLPYQQPSPATMHPNVLIREITRRYFPDDLQNTPA